MWKFEDKEVIILTCTLVLLISALVVFFTDLHPIILVIEIAIAVYCFYKYSNFYFNYEKHEKKIFSTIKNPLFIDNRIWMHHGDYKPMFTILEKYCKKYKTQMVLLRMQLDEIEQIKHRSTEDTPDFNNAKVAIDFIEGLQKKGVLTIRGIGLKRIIDIEGEDNSDPKAPEAQVKSKELEEDNPLAEKGADYKTPQEGRYKSRLAEGIKNILNDEFSKVKQINLMSDTPEIRVRVRAYVTLVKDRKVDIVNIADVTKSAEFLIEYTPKTVEQKYKATKYVKKKQEIQKKHKARKAIWEFPLKQYKK